MDGAVLHPGAQESRPDPEVQIGRIDTPRGRELAHPDEEGVRR